MPSNYLFHLRRSGPTTAAVQQIPAANCAAIPDGFRILKFILHLWKDYRPLGFFASIAAVMGLAALTVALHAGGHLHAWTPATFAFAGLMSFACFAFLAGIVLDSVNRKQREVKRMLYLAVPEGGGALFSGLTRWPTRVSPCPTNFGDGPSSPSTS